MNKSPSTITIELVNEPGQPPWWKASFTDHHGFGRNPGDALDNLFEVMVEAILTLGAGDK